MQTAHRRITLIRSGASATDRAWQVSAATPTRVMQVQSLSVLRHLLAGGIDDFKADIERVILDRCGDASDYLTVLATLPQGFTGDVVMICSDGESFVSSSGRGGDRVLNALTERDLNFYFEAHHLVECAQADVTLRARMASPARVWMRAAA